MANVVLFRLQDDETVWLADLEAGTVERTDAFDTDDGDAPRLQGVDLAIATTARSEAASHFFFPSRGVRVEGVDFAVAAKARPAAASHFLFPSR